MIRFRVQLTTKAVRVGLYRKQTGGLFYARFWHGGKAYHRGTDAVTETAARAAARRMLEELEQGAPAKPTDSLEKLKDAYLAERWPAKTGNRSYQNASSRLTKFAKYAEAHPFPLLPRREASGVIQGYLSTRASKAALTVKTDQLVISRFCTWLIKTGRAHWESNPAAALHMDLPPVESRTKPFLSDAEVKALLAAAKQSEVWPLVLLCLGGGLRPREATQLRWEAIDLERGQMNVFGKRRERTVTLTSWVRQELQAWKDAHPGPKPFRFDYFTGFSMFRELRKEKGLSDNTSLQALRRTAARKAAEKMSMLQYANFFGHSLEVAHKHYIGYGLVGDRAAVEALNFGALAEPEKKPDTKPDN